MADYYPLLARALDAMPERSPALRQAVYERARGALIGQLRSLDPPLSEDDIDLERNALEAAIRRLEQEHGAPPVAAEPPASSEPFVPSPANDATDLPEPSRPEPPAAESPTPAPPEPPRSQADAPPASLPEADSPKANPPEASAPEAPQPEATPPEIGPPAETALPRAVPPPAPVPELVTATPPSAPEPSEPAIRIQARKGKAPPFMVPDAEPAPAPEAGAEPAAETAEAASQRQRPRIEVVAPREGRSRLLRNLFVGSILVVVIGLIAVAAYLLRDKPADLQPVASAIQDNAGDGAESKFADRVGGEAAQPERAAPPRPSPTPAPTPAPGQPELAIAQRAVLYEEKSGGGTNATPSATQGRVSWRLDTVPGEQGQPLETVVRARADFPDAGLSLAMTLRRNLDATLPASHTIELVFTPSGPSAAQHNVQDIGLLQGKDEESARGSPVSGLPVRVRENLFLIGLSSLPNDIERNTDILLRKNWFDVTLKFGSGLRGVIAFEKGGAGAQVLQNAFNQWR